MVRAIIDADVTEIAELRDWVYRAWDDKAVVGLGEMPLELAHRLGMCSVDTMLTMDETESEEGKVDLLRTLVSVAFLMGRKFGNLESSTGLKNIVATVPMAPCIHKTIEYDDAVSAE